MSRADKISENLVWLETPLLLNLRQRKATDKIPDEFAQMDGRTLPEGSTKRKHERARIAEVTKRKGAVEIYDRKRLLRTWHVKRERDTQTDLNQCWSKFIVSHSSQDHRIDHEKGKIFVNSSRAWIPYIGDLIHLWFKI